VDWTFNAFVPQERATTASTSDVAASASDVVSGPVDVARCVCIATEAGSSVCLCVCDVVCDLGLDVLMPLFHSNQLPQRRQVM
jgi:hypothetical protein